MIPPLYVQNITIILLLASNDKQRLNPSLCLTKTQTTANLSINWLRC